MEASTRAAASLSRTTTRNRAWRRRSAQVCLRTDHAVDDIDARDQGFCIVAHASATPRLLLRELVAPER
jgi:hypothetical protein